jgi:hypothetical protein
MVLPMLLAIVALVLLALVIALMAGWVVWGEEPWDPGARERADPDGTRSNRWLD